jgi:hypothetical protein
MSDIEGPHFSTGMAMMAKYAWLLLSDLSSRCASTPHFISKRGEVTRKVPKSASSVDETTQSCLLAHDEHLMLHVVHGQDGFNKDYGPSCANQGRKSLPSSHFIIFSLPNIYM